MLAGQLFVLFGLDVKDDTFRAAYKHLAGLQLVGTAVARVVRGIGEGLTELLTESAEAGTHLLGTAASLGMSTKTVQEWSYVAKQAGSNIDQFVVGISMFERNLREFAAGRGSKRFQDAMAEVGMSHAQAKQALVGPDGINTAIFQVSDAYLRMGNTANRAAINTGLFGARARGMAQDLGQGSAALRQRIAELHGIGGVVDNAQLQQLKEFDNAITKAKTSLHALAMEVVAGVSPVFIELINSITVWIGENKELISDVLGTAFKVLAFVFQSLFAVVEALGAIIHGVMDGDDGAIILFSLLTAGVLLLAGTMITILLPAISIIGAALWTAMAPLIPFGIAAAVLIALAAEIVLHWGAVKEWFAGFWPWLEDIVDTAGRAITAGYRTVADALISYWDNVKARFWAMIDEIVDKAAWGVNTIIHGLNMIPGVNIGDVQWAQHNTGQVGANQPAGAGAPAVSPAMVPGAPHTPTATFGTPSGTGGLPGGPLASNVSIAPTTVNIYGVKDAAEASGHIATAIDQQNRHAAAALGGEVA